MSRYSIGAYRIALEMRSARTLLVEGETDKAVLQRLLLDVSAEGPRPSIDTPALLADPDLHGLGNKAKVELVAARITKTEKFLALVDREWESFNSSELALANIEGDLAANGGLLRTFGHSIENYFLEERNFSTLLRRHFSAQLRNGTLRLLEERFSGMCSLALAFSLAARDHQIIGASGGLISRHRIQIDDANFSLRDELKADLIGRGIAEDIAEQFLSSVADYQARIKARGLPHSVLKWASHGHLGGEVVWSCIARVVQEVDGDSPACEQIERGMKPDKLKHGADVLATAAHERRPLDWVARWLHGLENLPAPLPAGA